MKLSIIIPVFNEQNTILQILEKINMVDFIQKEISYPLKDTFLRFEKGHLITIGFKNSLRNIYP